MLPIILAAIGGYLIVDSQKDDTFADGGLIHSLNQAMTNLTKNGIVITDEKSGTMAILYNTGNQSRKLGLYNTSLLYKTISEIDKDAASRMVVNINQGIFDEFDIESIDKYKNSKTLLILNQNEVLYNSNNPDIRFKDGGRTIAQTPAPKSDRIVGSKVNPKGSAASEKSASKIILSKSITDTLQNKLSEFKEKHPNKQNISLSDLKAVYRRGAGAYSSSHRPTISGGKPNSRNAWAMARVNKFLLKAGGTKVKAAYVQDDDLM
jgi:hypothetical protein